MRILYHHRTQGEEPESIHIGAIVRALIGLGHEVRVVGPSGAGHLGSARSESMLLGRIKRAVPGPVFEVLQLGYNVVVYWRLWHAARQFRPDLIYERYALYNFAGVWLAKRQKIPLILEVNTPYAQAWDQYFGLTLRTLAQWIERRTLLAADHIITVTEVQQRMLAREGIPIKRISICHNAIDPEWFDPHRHADPNLKRCLGLKEIVVGFVGTMNRWQGITEFPTVLSAVLTQRSDVCFLFVGDGEFRDTLEKFCRSAGFGDRVVFIGRKRHAEIPALIGVMDIAVLLNSNSYGSPMKIFEYLGMQKAVIAPSVGPVTEVLKDGDTGLLIAPGDAEQMAQKILQLCADAALRCRLGLAGRAYVVAHHTWRRNAMRIVEIYSGLARDSG